jgi:molybdopterin molybdotransferase
MSLLPVEDALARIFAHVPAPQAEWVPLADAAGRILAAPLVAGHDQPPFAASAMDGYAVRSADFGTDPEKARSVAVRQRGVSAAGKGFAGKIDLGETVRIFTGAPMPEGADAVVMQEDAIVDGDAISFSTLPKPGQSVRPLGYDFKAGQELLPAGFRLTPYALTLAAAANQHRLSVWKRPSICILATGDELVSPGSPLGRDQIVSSNSAGLMPLLSGHAVSVADLGIVGDDFAAVRAKIEQALQSDIVVTTGGASVGDHDIVQDVLKDLGVSIDFWRINMRPGKPLMFGTKGKTLVFGLPGNPVSALVTATVFVLPTLNRWQQTTNPNGTQLRLPLAAPLPANGSRRHFLRATLETADGITAVRPNLETDSGHTSSLGRAQVLVVQQENSAPLAAGSLVDVILLPGFQ